MSNIVEDLKYTIEHTYVRLEGNIATVGVTDFAQRQLGDLVLCNVEVKVGDKLVAQKQFGMLESGVKGLAEVYSPVRGTIQQVNEELSESPELINEDPYGEGWIVKIRVDDTSSVENLLSASEYEQYIKEEGE